MSAFVDPVLRGVLFVFLVIALGLTASLIEDSNHTNSQVNFALFSTVFGLTFGVFYGLLAGFVELLAFPIALATIDFLDLVFTFAGATAVAAAIHVHSCKNQVYLDNNTITQGSTGRCRRAQCTVAFLYFAFFLSIAQLALSVSAMIKNGAFALPGRRRAGPPRTGVPSMSQV